MMTPEQQVVADATTTLQDACIAAGMVSPMEELAASKANLVKALDDLATMTQARDDALNALQPVMDERDKLKADARAYLAGEDTLRKDVGA